jgi:glutamine cyclotransferase
MSAIFGHLVVVFFCYIVVIVVLASSSKKNQSFSRVRSIQHDDKCFTQGLFIHDGKIIESCGLNGKSSIRIVHAHNGSVIKEKRLQHKYFAEGLAVVNNTIYVLTWRNKEIIVLDLHTLEILESRPFYTYTVNNKKRNESVTMKNN